LNHGEPHQSFTAEERSMRIGSHRRKENPNAAAHSALIVDLGGVRQKEQEIKRGIGG
jgi:hypothetical protein